MKIKEIIVKDFGGIETQIIEPQKITCLLGKNGASKSTILTAIKRAFIGKMEPDDIRVGASKAHVTIVFDDGTSIERIRGKDRSVVKVNDKTTSQESANEFLVGKLGVPLSIYETMFGTDYFAELSKKDLTALLLSMLQVQIDYKKIIEAAESRMDTLPEAVKEYLKKMFPTGVFGLETIDEVASKVADANRAEKKILVTYTEKSKYEGEIPKDSKEELEKLLSENMQKQAEWKETQKTLQKYQMLIQQREQALKKKESIQHELESLSTVTEIPREVYEQAVSDRQKFLNASRIANQNIAAANANIKFQKQILHNISSFEQNNHSCPICPSVHCNADLSAYVRQGQGLVQKNKDVVKQNKDFLVRCDEQIAKRDQIIEKYQKNQVEITKKQALKKQLEEFVIPQLPEKQTNVPNEEELRLLVEQQKLIQQRMRTLEEYETTRKYSKLCREQQDKVDMLSLAAKTLDAKVGVKGIILQRILHPFEEACTACMQKLSRNTKIKFIYDGGVELYCEKNGGKMVPMKKVSTGEFVFVAFTLMSLISQITGTRLLVLDNLDSLDNDNLKTLIDLLQNEKQYENVFVAAVNHDDTCATIAQYDEVEIIEL